MKQIHFVIQSLQFGGAERVMTELASYFCDKGYKVTIITLYREVKGYDIENRIHRINLNIPTNGIKKLVVGRKKLRECLKQENATICISFDILANILTLLSAPSTIYRIISERNAPKQTSLSLASKILRFLIYRKCDLCVFQTEEARKCYGKEIQKKGVVIPNPVKQTLPYIHKENRKNEIVAVGRLERQKNYEEMILGFELFYSEHSNYVLKIYGDGSQKDSLKEMIRTKGLDECVLIYDAKDDVHEYMKEADIFLMTSLYEGIPNSLMEAMAMGYAVVAYDCPIGGCRLLIEDNENGILLERKNVFSIAESLSKLADDADLRDKLGKNAIKVRERFSIDHVGNMWKQLIELREEK